MFFIQHSAFSIQTSALPAWLPFPSAPAVVSAAASSPAAVSATAPTATATPAAATESAFRFRSSLVHHERATVHLMLMEFADGLRRILVVHHFDEREAAGAAGRHVPHHPDVVHLAGAAEQLRELVFRGRIGEVPDIDSPAHLSLTPS